MSVIDGYLKKIDEPKRKELERIRKLVQKIVPSMEDVIAYAMPTLKYRGKYLIGVDAHKKHIGIYQYSGEVVGKLGDKVAHLKHSSGAIQIPLDQPISESLLREILKLRIEQIERTK